MRHSEYFEFPIEHQLFYDQFEPWRSQKNKEHEHKEGVYCLLAGKPVPRCLKEDMEGILYIGKGIVLSPQHRLGKLINAINATEAMHEAGLRYNNKLLTEKYPIAGMKLRVVLCEESRKVESELLANYVHEFGELPPLNRQL